MKKIILKTIFVLLLIIEFYPLEANSQKIAEDANAGIMKVTKDAGKYFELYQADPEEFKEVTTIKFNIFNQGTVELNVYDLEGKKITTLVEGYMEPGQYNVFFKAFKEMMPGEYLYKLEENGSEQVKKMYFIK